jgi:hypothetical protein
LRGKGTLEAEQKDRMGAQRQQFTQYYFEYGRSLFEYLIIPKPHDPISSVVDARIAEGVTRNLLLMLTTIKLDHKLRVHAREICHILANRNLPAKSKTVQLPAP